MKKLYMLLAVVLIMVITGCSSSWDPIPPPSSSVKAITAFSLAGVVGTINETGKTIAVAMPYGTDVTALVATFITTGASVKVGSTVQISGTTANNFTSPVVYTVTAADATTQDYTVVVTVALSSAKAITAFSLDRVVGTINETGKTIAVTMPFGTSVTNLVATFTTTGVSVNVDSTVQTSGTTANNFTNPVIYTVTAADGSTQDYTVTIAVAASPAKAITAFSLDGSVGTINETGKTIAVSMPYGTYVMNLVATFTTTGASVKVGSTVQISGTTAHNFTNPVTYTVTAADSSTQNYTVTVTVALSSVKAITAFSLDGVDGTINETEKTIAVTMPFDTGVTALVATFITTGASVKVGSTVQISGTTANNFTSPVVYTVTAADATTQDYTVVVTVALSSAKAITAFSLAGVVGTINETGKTIAVAMPYGTDVTALVATFITTGASVKVGSTVQISGTTANNFTAPVIYTATAADATTQDYTVTVAVALSSAKAITAFSLDGVVGTINETAKTIAVTMPSGTGVTALKATFTTTGASVNVDSTVQTSGTTANNFTSPVTYTVTAADTTTQNYTVTVTVAPSTVPGAPTIGTATAGDAQATVTFTVPGSNGGSAITGYTVTSSLDNISGTGTVSPITVTGLTNGTAYTFTVTATNAIGTSVASSASNSVTPALAIGQTYQGGIIAYLLVFGDTGYDANVQHGLIATINDQNSGIAWALGTTNQGTLVGGTSQAIGTGSANTTLIVTQNGAGTNYAAGICDAWVNTDTGTGAYNDWYLPSLNELMKLYLNRVAIGGFASAYYWSSSEYTSTNVFGENFNNGSPSNAPKSTAAYVRAIRAF